MNRGAHHAYLIVNADDYGYFDCVSRGILRCATAGIVTATGVFANAERFDPHVRWLLECPSLDAGVHLNLTQGFPLTHAVKDRLARWSGKFPGKFAMASAVLTGTIRIADVKAEWRAQIERCQAAGLNVRFLNSHEHLHMLPMLLPVARSLAVEYGIPHVRLASSGPGASFAKGGMLRGAIMKGLELVARGIAGAPSAHFLGMEASGRLDLKRLERCVTGLRAGRVHELMCHPGEFDRREVTDARLIEYHAWEDELATLTSDAARQLLAEQGIVLVGYRHVRVEGDRFVVDPDPSALPQAV